jgi:hypothetical protein
MYFTLGTDDKLKLHIMEYKKINLTNSNTNN